MSAILVRAPLGKQSDRRLVELARAGDERAFETLTRRYWRQLLVYAGRLLGPDNRAEDACQQALLQAWLALRGGTEVREVRAWLYGIVHNSVVTMIRRAHHETVELDEADRAQSSEPSQQEARLVLAEIFERLSAMPADQRDALVMTAVRGQTRAETAAALGLTDGAVRGLIYRARSSLRGAVAGVLPMGFSNWLSQVGDWLTSTAGSETTAGGASSAGIVAAVIKGGAVLAAAGALVAAGPDSRVTSTPATGHHHSLRGHRSAGGHSAARPTSAQARVNHDLREQSTETAVERVPGDGSQSRHDEIRVRQGHPQDGHGRRGSPQGGEGAGAAVSESGRPQGSESTGSPGGSGEEPSTNGHAGDGGSGKQETSGAGTGRGPSPETGGSSGSGTSGRSGSSPGAGRQSASGSETSSQTASNRGPDPGSGSGDTSSSSTGSGSASSSGDNSSGGHDAGTSSDAGDSSTSGSGSNEAKLPG